MDKALMINEYLEWRQNKTNELRYSGDDILSPETWLQEVIMSESYARMNILKDLLENEALEPLELANRIHDIVYQPLEELMNDPVSMGASGEAQPLG